MTNSVYNSVSAATGSSQASPTDVVKHIVEQELSRNESSEVSKVPIVPQEELSPLNDEAGDPDSENAERGSLHCVEATAVRQLAASTGTVAILGTTAKCKEDVDYRRSVYSEQGFVIDVGDELVGTQKDEQEPSEKELKRDMDVTTPSDVTESTNIVTTATIEVPPSNINYVSSAVDEKDKDGNVETVSELHDRVGNEEFERLLLETKTKSNKNSDDNYLPKVVQSIEKCVKRDSSDPVMKIPTNYASVEQKEEQSENSNPDASKIRESLEVEETELLDDKVNGSSEKESTSSEVVSVVNEAVKEQDLLVLKRASFESNRPNRLSLGQQSIESDQNTLEISSADDVVKNESTDVTSPESLKESFEECLIKGIIVRAKIDPDGESSKEENAKEISNTSLNTLGNDSEEDGSDLEVDISTKKTDTMMKRFDTISSNGESSYRMEEQNYPSVTEEPELEEYAVQQRFGLEPMVEEVFDNDEHIRLKENVRESAINEVNRICDQAVEKTTDILIARTAVEEAKDLEDVNNVSESSILSAIDSVVAEKGSDFDSLSFLDEQSDSRSVSVLGDDTKSCRSEVIYELHTGVSTPRDDVQRRLHEWEQLSTLVTEVKTRIRVKNYIYS